MKILILLVLVSLCLACGSSNTTLGTSGGGNSGSSSTSITHETNCIASDSGSGTNLQFQYASATTSAGDRYITCTVNEGNLPSSYTVFYDSTQPGATSGACFVNMGLATSDFGYWEFTDTSGTVQAVYTDTGSVKNGYSFIFATGNCTSF